MPWATSRFKEIQNYGILQSPIFDLNVANMQLQEAAILKMRSFEWIVATGNCYIVFFCSVVLSGASCLISWMPSLVGSSPRWPGRINCLCNIYSGTGVNNSYDENFFVFCMWVHYHIIYSISTKKWYVTKQIKKIWVSVWNEVWLDLSLLTQILRKWRESMKLIILLMIFHLGLPYLFSLI